MRLSFPFSLLRRRPRQGHDGAPKWPRRAGFVPPRVCTSDDAAASPVTGMTFGYHGEIFVDFADGRRTCVWPSGDPVSPSSIRIRSPEPRK